MRQPPGDTRVGPIFAARSEAAILAHPDGTLFNASEGSSNITHPQEKLLHFAGATVTAAGYNVRRSLGVSPRALEQAAKKTWEIAPGVDEPHVPLYIPESHFSRIVGSSPPPQPITELIASIKSDRHQAGATRAFLLRNAILFRHHVHCGWHRGDLYSTLDWRSLWRAETAEVDQCVLATTYSGARWFGHFMHDELPLQELAPSVGNPVGHLRRTYAHEPGWRAALGVPLPPGYAVVRARELIWIDDRGQNPAKRARYQAMQSRLKGLPIGHDRVLLRRPSSGGESRQIINIEEVETRLQRAGFHIVDTGRLTVDKILEDCMGASLIVSVEGSHASPAYYFARRGACILFIYPPDRVSLLMPRLAGFYGQVGAMFIGQPMADGDAAFHVDPDELIREIDRAAEFAARSAQ
jgi:Glycosyltransferase 61